MFNVTGITVKPPKLADESVATDNVVEFDKKRTEGKSKKKNAPAGSAQVDTEETSLALWYSNFVLDSGQFRAEGAGTPGGTLVRRWNGVYWQVVHSEDGLVHAQDWLRRWGRKAFDDGMAAKLWRTAARDLRTRMRMPERDRNRYIVADKTCYYELHRSGRIEVLAPDRQLGLTHGLKISLGGVVGVDHVPQAIRADSLFMSWLSRAQPDAAVRAHIQEQCGMFLLPESYRVAVWWHGESGCGKSTLAELAVAMQEAAVSKTMPSFSKNFGTEDLIGSTLVFVDEVEEGSWNEAFFRTWVAGQTVGVDRKFERPLSNYRPTAKFLFTSNPAPWFRDTSGAVASRIDAVHWAVSIPESERRASFDKELIAREGAAILDWMLAGALRLVQRGSYTTQSERPLAVQKNHKAMLHNADPILDFIEDEQIRVEVGAAVAKSKVTELYTAWARSANQRVLDNEILWRHLRARLPKMEQTRPRGIHSVNLAFGAPVATAPAQKLIAFDAYATDQHGTFLVVGGGMPVPLGAYSRVRSIGRRTSTTSIAEDCTDPTWGDAVSAIAADGFFVTESGTALSQELLMF